jgi:hypothetical protein
VKVIVDRTCEHLAMKKLGVKNPYIPNFGSRCHWEVSCMFRSCYPFARSLCFQCEGRLDGRQSQSGYDGSEHKWNALFSVTRLVFIELFLLVYRQDCAVLKDICNAFV